MTRLKYVVVLVLGYSALILVMTYPLVLHLGTHVAHDLGDPILSLLILSWNAHVVPLTKAWWDGWYFWPSTGVLAFSDHRLGESLLASPLQWMGIGPIAAYNATLLATFPACALAAHWMAFTLTRRHDAALVAGLTYGFNPYRFTHIEHLELLAAFGMPVALGALHEYLEQRRAGWLIVFGAALFLQALLSSYYFLFFSVMLALWMIWFLRKDDGRAAVLIVVASAVVLALISPISLEYFRIHRYYGFVRGLGDIVELSADVSSMFTAGPLSAIWRWTSPLNGGERQLFPGATLLALVTVVVVMSLISGRRARRFTRAITVLIALGAFFALVALSVSYLGPWKVGRLSVGTFYKPFSLAFYSWLAAFLLSAPVRNAYSRRSTFGFYVLCALALFLFSLGPRAALLNHQFLYESPYSWLMRISVFRDSVRVPARFGMLVILSLSGAAAIAWTRLVSNRAIAKTSLVAVAIVADSWISGLALPQPPPSWPETVATKSVEAVLALPMDTMRDIAAMYRGSLAGVRTINGNSGYEPPHYRPMIFALENHDETVFNVIAERGPILVAVDRTAPGGVETADWLKRSPAAAEVQSGEESTFFIVRGHAGGASGCTGRALSIVAAHDLRGPVDTSAFTDGSVATSWTAGESQHAGDTLTLDLGRVVNPCGVRISLGKRPGRYPNALSIATSDDANSFTVQFNQKLGGETIRAALANPVNPTLDLPLSGEPARYVRLRIEADQPKAAWTATEIAVVGRDAGR